MKNPLALLKNTKHKKKVTMAKIPNAFVFSFLIIFMANMLVALAILLFENGALAADPKIFATEEKNDLGAYLLNIYNYGIGLIGVLAAIVMMWGGLMWTTAGGDSGRLQEAQAWIFAALSGLVLALSSVMILNLVNPALIKQKSIDISTGDGNLGNNFETPSPQKSQNVLCCDISESKVYSTTAEVCTLAISIDGDYVIKPGNEYLCTNTIKPELQCYPRFTECELPNKSIGYCSSVFRCTKKEPTGSWCYKDKVCQSSRCRNNLCINPFCTQRTIPCTTNAQCCSGSCSSGLLGTGIFGNNKCD